MMMLGYLPNTVTYHDDGEKRLRSLSLILIILETVILIYNIFLNI